MKDLTNEQLCALAQAGDEQSVSLLIKANLLFVWKAANQIVENPVRQEHLSACGVGFDDLMQAGSIGLWRAIDNYDLSGGVKFLTYAAPAIKRSMSDLIRQYSRDTIWQLRHDKANAWNIIYLDEDLDDAGFEIPERAYARAEDKLTKDLVAADELHAVELRLKLHKNRGKKITAAVYEYLADCNGDWGEIFYDFKDGTAEIILLAEWDTMVSQRFAMRAIEHFRIHHSDELPDKIVLTFIGPEQRSVQATKN